MKNILRSIMLFFFFFFFIKRYDYEVDNDPFIYTSILSLGKNVTKN